MLAIEMANITRPNASWARGLTKRMLTIGRMLVHPTVWLEREHLTRVMGRAAASLSVSVG